MSRAVTLADASAGGVHDSVGARPPHRNPPAALRRQSHTVAPAARRGLSAVWICAASSYGSGERREHPGPRDRIAADRSDELSPAFHDNFTVDGLSLILDVPREAMGRVRPGYYARWRHHDRKGPSRFNRAKLGRKRFSARVACRWSLLQPQRRFPGPVNQRYLR